MSASSNPTDDLHEDQLQDLIVNWKKSSQRLRNLRFFVMLDLSGNNISGEIPASLGNLKALQQLNISHNKISGNIPLSLGNLVRIESLDVSHNQLSGKIPRGRQMDTMNELSYFQNNSGLCGMQIKITCPGDIPSLEGRVEEEEDLSWMFWEGTWIGFPIGFFSTILIMSYLLKFIQLFKISNTEVANILASSHIFNISSFWEHGIAGSIHLLSNAFVGKSELLLLALVRWCRIIGIDTNNVRHHMVTTCRIHN
ncbi:leucine-rich repeat-containing protein [Tanacetum coccineum]